jgi:hypothetical protein
MIDKDNIIKAFSEFIEKHFGETQAKSEPTIEVAKAVDVEKRQALFVALMAHKDETSFDLHGDTYDAEEVEKACHSYNTSCMKTNLGHVVMVDDNVCSVIESYIAPVDMQIGDQYVTKGSWLQVWQFADDDLWQGVKAGEWSGISIGCMAEVEEIE